MATGMMRPQTAPDDPLLPGPLHPSERQLPQLHGSSRRRGSTLMGKKTWVMPRAVAVAPATYYLSPRKGGVPASVVSRDAARAPPSFGGLRAASARGSERPRPFSGEDLRAEPPYTHRPTTSGSARTFRVDPNYVNTGLERVRARVQEEALNLERAGRNLPEFAVARLEMHQHLLDRLLGTFRGYAPAFAKIKAEFDQAIAARQAQLVKAREQAVQMQALNCGYDLELPAIQERYERAMKPDRERLAVVRHQIAMIHEILADKTTKLKAAVEQHKGMHETHDEVEDQQQVLAMGMRAGETQLKQMTQTMIESDSSVWQTKNDIRMSNIKMGVAIANVERKAGDVAEKEAEATKTHDEIMDLHVKVQQMTKKVRDSATKLEDMIQQRKDGYELLEQKKAESVDRTRPTTPCPDWPEAQASLAKFMQLDTTTSTQDSVRQMLHMIEDLITRTEEAKDDFRQQAIHDEHAPDEAEKRKRVVEAADEAGANKKWLLCLGRGSNVPSYLRAAGKVKNKNLSRSFVVKWIEEFWENKASGVKSRLLPVDEFFDNHLTLKYGSARGRVEWVYNLMFGIKRYNYDHDCQSFMSILNGEIPEVVYYAQKKLLVLLMQVLEKADKVNHGGRLWNTLSRTEFCETVEAQFKLKTEEEKKALRRALAQDQPLPDIRYRELFEPVDGIAGKYMETLREQFIQEVQGSYERVESSIRKVAMEDAVARQSIRQMRPEQCYSYLGLIKGVWLFQNAQMSDEEMLALIGKMEIVELHEGDVIVYEGAPTSHCYILDEGVAVAVKEGEEQPVKSYTVGDMFGDVGILKSDPSKESIVAKASKRGTCRCVRMSAAVFKEVQLQSDDMELLLHQRTLQYQLEATRAQSPPPRRPQEGGEDNEDKEKKKHEGYSIVVTVAAIRRALLEHYDKAIPKREVARLISLGLGHEAEEGDDEHDDELSVSLQSFMDGVRTTIVPRFSLPEEVSDRKRRENFLRDVSASEREAIEAVFNELDDSGDGSLDIDELERLLMEIYGMEPTKLQLQQLMHAIDLDGDGSVDMDEFVSAMATVKEVRLAGEIFKWRQLFDRFDADGSGELGHEELEEMTTKMWGAGHSSTMKMKKYMLEEADADGDGLVSWPEFRTMMMKVVGGFGDVLEMSGQADDTAEAAEPTTPKAGTRDSVQMARTSTRLTGYMDTDQIGGGVQVGDKKVQLQSTDGTKLVTGAEIANMTPIAHGGKLKKKPQKVSTAFAPEDLQIEAAPATPGSAPAPAPIPKSKKTVDVQSLVKTENPDKTGVDLHQFADAEVGGTGSRAAALASKGLHHR
jgi:Ca2+-binding EF-hand superfamily protein/CRP-like cAMP-binding protein